MFEKITAHAARKCYAPHEKNNQIFLILLIQMKEKIIAKINTSATLSKKTFYRLY